MRALARHALERPAALVTYVVVYVLALLLTIGGLALLVWVSGEVLLRVPDGNLVLVAMAALVGGGAVLFTALPTLARATYPALASDADRGDGLRPNRVLRAFGAAAWIFWTPGRMVAFFVTPGVAMVLVAVGGVGALLPEGSWGVILIGLGLWVRMHAGVQPGPVDYVMVARGLRRAEARRVVETEGIPSLGGIGSVVASSEVGGLVAGQSLLLFSFVAITSIVAVTASADLGWVAVGVAAVGLAVVAFWALLLQLSLSIDVSAASPRPVPAPPRATRDLLRTDWPLVLAWALGGWVALVGVAGALLGRLSAAEGGLVLAYGGLGVLLIERASPWIRAGTAPGAALWKSLVTAPRAWLRRPLFFLPIAALVGGAALNVTPGADPASGFGVFVLGLLGALPALGMVRTGTHPAEEIVAAAEGLGPPEGRARLIELTGVLAAHRVDLHDPESDERQWHWMLVPLVGAGIAAAIRHDHLARRFELARRLAAEAHP